MNTCSVIVVVVAVVLVGRCGREVRFAFTVSPSFPPLAALMALIGPRKVMSGRAPNAFCCVRPPGHHAEPDKAMGFCFFNNAPIGALHAKVGIQSLQLCVTVRYVSS